MKSNVITLLWKYVPPLLILIVLIGKPFAEQAGKNSDINEIKKQFSYPVFPSCINNSDNETCFKTQLKKHMRNHFKIPHGISPDQLKVYYFIKVDTNGKANAIRINTDYYALQREIERVIELLPPLKQPKMNGTTLDLFPLSINLEL